jgi:hypothetical protein
MICRRPSESPQVLSEIPLNNLNNYILLNIISSISHIRIQPILEKVVGRKCKSSASASLLLKEVKATGKRGRRRTD